MKAKLCMNDVNLMLYLGHPDEERSTPQRVTLQIDLSFNHPILAMHSDQLEDTVCYKALEDLLRERFEQQAFHLLEHLGYACYQTLQAALPPDVEICFSVTKYLGEQSGSRTFTLSNKGF